MIGLQHHREILSSINMHYTESIDEHVSGSIVFVFVLLFSFCINIAFAIVSFLENVKDPEKANRIYMYIYLQPCLFFRAVSELFFLGMWQYSSLVLLVSNYESYESCNIWKFLTSFTENAHQSIIFTCEEIYFKTMINKYSKYFLFYEHPQLVILGRRWSIQIRQLYDLFFWKWYHQVKESCILCSRQMAKCVENHRATQHHHASNLHSNCRLKWWWN